jgi:hypothetical protein
MGSAFDPAKLYKLERVAEVLDLKRDAVLDLCAREGVALLRLSRNALRVSGAGLVELLDRAAKRPPSRRGGAGVRRQREVAAAS